MRRGFDDIPGSLPLDKIPQDLDLNTVPFPDIAECVLDNLFGSPIAQDALWRDHFAMTGQVRTFSGSDNIIEQWALYSRERCPEGFKAEAARISRPTPNSSWVDVPFTFVTRQAAGLQGNCSGTMSFVPTQEGAMWDLWMLRTLLENFEGYGHPDDPSPIFNLPKHAASSESQFEVPVLIVGAGQAGLSVAGRLGALRIPYILVEKEAEIGYSWTGKYDGVRQHTIREMNNLPFERTYKATDPELLPAKTVAEGFQNYVRKYNINVWLAAEVEKCLQKDSGDTGWVINVRKGKKEYVVKATHLVLCMGASLSVPNPPKIQNASSFRGTTLDIGVFKNSMPWRGKKGVVVGSATTAHDVAQDMLDNGLSSITMIQRRKTPIFPMEWCAAGQSTIYNLNIPPRIADQLEGTQPFKISREITKTHFMAAAGIEKERFDALERVGFRVDREAVLNDWVFLRGGGYYIDVGTSKRIASGEIKVKSGIPIKRFVENGIEFEDGEVLDADLVVFATGYQRDPRIQAATIVGEEVARSMIMGRGFDEDGEIQRNVLPVGRGLWLTGGAVPQARWNSRFIALQIQAELMGKPFPDSSWRDGGKGYAKETKL